MKSNVTIVLAVFVFGLLTPSVWARGMGNFGGGHNGHAIGGHFTGSMGHFGGGFLGGRGGQNLLLRVKSLSERAIAKVRSVHQPNGA